MVALALSAGACHGVISSGADLEPSSSNQQRPENPTVPVEGTFAPGLLHRLTRAQYQSSVSDLLGPSVVPSIELSPDPVADGLTAIGAATLALSGTDVEKYDKSASDLARQAFADPTRRRALTKCQPSGPSDASCARTFIERFGRLAFRRPLTADEVTTYVTLATRVGIDSGDPWLGLELSLSAMLQSPHFLYRVELGEPGRSGASPLNAYELATRLSYLLLGTTPSSELLSLADSGALLNTSTLAQQATQMLNQPQSRKALSDFFVEMIGLRELTSLKKNTMVFPEFNPGLSQAMEQEVRQLFQRFGFEKSGSLLELYDTKDTFVNTELASLYALPRLAGQGAQWVTHSTESPRAGLLTTAGFLAQHAFADRTSATERGKAVRQSLLCQTVPAPPMDVPTVLPPSTPDRPLTARERLANHSTDPSCKACHSLMDPVGLGLEHFDGIGRYRDTDQGRPLDVTGELDGVAYQDAVGLAQALRRHPSVGRCFVQQLYRHSTGHREEPGEVPGIDALAEVFKSEGERLPNFVVRFVTGEPFRTVGPAP